MAQFSIRSVPSTDTSADIGHCKIVADPAMELQQHIYIDLRPVLLLLLIIPIVCCVCMRQFVLFTDGWTKLWFIPPKWNENMRLKHFSDHFIKFFINDNF